jgi:hypothetical protein
MTPAVGVQSKTESFWPKNHSAQAGCDDLLLKAVLAAAELKTGVLRTPNPLQFWIMRFEWKISLEFISSLMRQYSFVLFNDE